MSSRQDVRQVPIEDLPVEVMDLYFLEARADAGEAAVGPRGARQVPTNARRRRARSRSWRVSYL